MAAEGAAPTPLDVMRAGIGPARFQWHHSKIGYEIRRTDLAQGGRRRHVSSTMLVEAIREFNRASPFVPYEIRTNGGERLRVPHPDFVLIAPRGGWVIVTDEQDHVRHISSLLIEEVAPVRKRTRRK